jgi:CheY-like chemotaxis protein
MPLEIIIVDDDPTIRLLYTIFLKKAEILHKVNYYTNGKECIHYLDNHENHEESSFLVLLDINMPIMNGWEFMDEIKKKPYQNNTNIILVTSSIDPEDKRKSKRYPRVLKYIEKPFTLSDALSLKELEPIKHLF